jgi:molecular chaperone GrpE
LWHGRLGYTISRAPSHILVLYNIINIRIKGLMFKNKKDKIEKELEKDSLEQLSENREEEIPVTEAEQEAPATEVSVEELNKKIEELTDLLKRKAAEFENYKRRTENDISVFYRYANESLLKEILPLLDDFDRVIAAFKEKHDQKTFHKGIELLYDKFKKTLIKQGLKEMDAEGKDFDVNLHDALMMQPDENSEPNKVLNVVEKGYFLNDKVLRHAKVIVSSKPEKEEN